MKNYMQLKSTQAQMEEISGLIGQEMYAEALQIVNSNQSQVRQDGNTKILILWSFFEIMIQWRAGRFRKAYDVVLELFDAMRAHGVPRWIGSTIVDLLMLFQDWHRALEIIDVLMSQDLQAHTLLLWKASIFRKLKEYAAEQELLHQVIQLNPESIAAHEAFAGCLTECGQYRRAMRYWEHAWEQGSTKAIHEMLRFLFVRKGKCNACEGKAMCCKNVTLSINGDAVCSKWQYERALIAESRNETWYYTHTNEKGQWIFNCPWLNEAGKCSHHRKRSNACRSFPQTVLAALRIQCSYRFELRRNAPKFKNAKALQAVCQELSNAGGAIQVAMLKEHNK